MIPKSGYRFRKVDTGFWKKIILQKSKRERERDGNAKSSRPTLARHFSAALNWFNFAALALTFRLLRRADGRRP
jgi:hypothetical protein